MSREGSLHLTLLDAVSHEMISDRVDIELRHKELRSERHMIRGVDGSKPIVIEDLYGQPKGFYRLEIRAKSYKDERCFVVVDSREPTRLEIEMTPQARTELAPAILRMSERDLRFITGAPAFGALGSSGTGSGDTCDGTIVHCCFPDPAVLRVVQVDDGYALETPVARFAIEVDETSSQQSAVDSDD